MTRTTQILLHTPVTRVSLVQLAFVLKLLRVARITTYSCLIFLASTVVVQLVYPSSIARPLAKIDGVSIGFKSVDSIKSNFNAYDNAKRTVTVGKTTYKLSLSSVGIKTNAQSTVNQVSDYPYIERLKPFSLLTKSDFQSEKKIDSKKLDQAIQLYISENTVAPINPKVEIAPTGLIVKAGSQGVTFNEAQLKDMLINMPANSSKVEYNGLAQAPVVDEQKLATVVETVNEQSAKQFKLNVQGKLYAATPEQVRSWARVNVDEVTGAILPSYDLASIKKWLLSSAPQTLKAAVPPKNVVVDNVVVQSQAGQPGTIIDADKTVLSISKALNSNTNTADAVLATVSAPAQQAKSFSATSQGINLLIANWAKSYPGMTAGVTFREVGGQSRQAGINGDRKFYPASIYKLFATLYLNTEIAAGRINPNSEILPGKSISKCMELMIVVSDNNCPLAVADTYGWGAFEAIARNRGFGSTSLSSSFSTTSNDVANYLTALNNGTLMPSGDTATLIDRMQRQIFRSAIPAGSPGCTVADKVGFYGAYWHDAAIVTCTNSKYVLVIFTQNGSPKAIKDLANQINALMN